MKIKIKSCLEGAKEAEGLTVVIDVLRASNTIISALHKGANYIIPVENLEDAYRLKRMNTEYLLFGERNGLPPDGFDCGNSPAEVSNLELKGKVVVFTTSAGTKAIVNAKNADEIIIASYANAEAVVNYIKNKNPDKVTLIAIGLDAYKKTEEDELCAQYIKELLEGKKPNYESMKQIILKSDGANRLRRLNQLGDLKFCTERLNSYDIVPKVVEEGELLTIRLYS
jgi:2-phosphosulfolactate phosphatase